MKKLLSIILLLGLGVVTSASSKNINDPLNKEFIKKNTIDTITADFTQEITDAEGNKRISKGYILAKRPNFMKWVYDFPQKRYIYINSSTTTIFEPNIMQAIVQKTPNMNTLDILTKAAKTGSWKKKYDGVTYILTFKDNKPYSLKYTDKMDNYINMTFSNVKINEDLLDSTFMFVPKEDIEILATDSEN